MLAGKDSFPEIAFVCFGRAAIYLINGLMIFAMFGPIVSNFIIVGDMGQACFGVARSVVILVGAALALYFCLQKTMSQLYATSLLSLLKQGCSLGLQASFTGLQ